MVQKHLTDEETFNHDINNINTAPAKLSSFEIYEKLMENYLFLQDSLNDIRNCIIFACLKILHFSILVKNNLPLLDRFSNVDQYLDIIELEVFQTNQDLVLVLKILSNEQQLHTVFHLYPIPVYDNRTELHCMLSFTKNTLRVAIIL